MNGFVSQRVEERKQLVFLFLGQSQVTPGYGTCLATVAQDGLVPRGGKSVMHQPVAGAQPPERRGSQFVGRVGRAVLHDSIAGTYVMQQKIAVRVDHFVPQCVRDAEHAAIDRGPWRGRGDGGPVAERTSNLGEDLQSRLRRRRGQQLRIYGWRRGTAHESSEVVDVFHTDVIGFIFGILRGLADGRRISGCQAAGDAHLVKVSVGRKGQQAGMLILPTKAPPTERLPWGF